MKFVHKATVTAHWPGKSVNVCSCHAAILLGMADAMGFDLSWTEYTGSDNCINCVNAAKQHAAPDNTQAEGSLETPSSGK
jgi:hypothetical protein